MKKLSKPSLKDWRQQLLALVLRFPTSIFFCIITCASWIFLNHKFLEDTVINTMRIFLMLYPVTALLLSLQLHLWTEEWQQQKRAWQVHLGIQVVGSAFAHCWQTLIRIPLSKVLLLWCLLL